MPDTLSSPLLQARGLTLALAGRTLFQGRDLDLAAGQRLLLRGASGTGKSTLLRCLAGLQRPDAGQVLLEGRDLRAVGPSTWRRRVALVAQGAPILPGSPAALEAELRGYRAHRGGAWDPPEPLAAALGLDAAAWRRDWSKLSGGERQRAHLALALAGRPEVLLLDEPTSALDPEAALQVEALLAGRTAVWVSHDPAVAARLGPDAVLEHP
ncbi:ABC transporter ATP-binding protein [Myxococcota bacterium]|nr:ABC transporter ATP-binding protein [Myxococcota bacterium]